MLSVAHIPYVRTSSPSRSCEMGRLVLWAMGMLSIIRQAFSLALLYEEAHDSPPWATHPFQLLLPPPQAKQRHGI